MSSRVFYLEGATFAELEPLSAAEIEALRAIELGEKLDYAVSLSNKTRRDPAKPWYLTAHSRTVSRLESRKRPLVATAIVRVGDRWETKAHLTERGRELLAAVTKRGE